MKRRLWIGSAIAIMAGLLIAFILAVPMIEGLLMREVRTRMDLALAMAGDEWLEGQQQTQDGGQIVRQVASLLEVGEHKVRVTVLDVQGNVLADSETTPKAMENHLERPEVQQALAEQRGYDVRMSETMKHRYYYAAKRLDGQILRIALPMEQLDATRIRLLLCAVIGLCGGFVVAMWLSIGLSRRIIRPVEEMASAAEVMAEGDFGVRVSPGKDELGVLAQDFNRMASRLEKLVTAQEQNRAQLDAVLQSMEDGVLAVDDKGCVLLSNPRAEQLLDSALVLGEPLKKGMAVAKLHNAMLDVLGDGQSSRWEWTVPGTSNILSVYISPLHVHKDAQATGAMAVLSDLTRMRRLEQMRSDFVANVTHELKTPLTSIRGYIELLQTGQRDEQTRNRFYEIIDIEAERLSALIEDILQLAEIEGSREQVHRRQTDLNDVIGEVVRRFGPHAKKREIALTVDVPQEAMVRGSAARLQQLLGNLVDNAIKYNRQGGSVQVHVRRERRCWVVRVEDTGIGIPQEHLYRIFERFYRVDKGRSRLEGGTGLGLSICRHIAALLGGSIQVDSTLGEGTVFTVTLPD